jgi:hypothetical protein
MIRDLVKIIRVSVKIIKLLSKTASGQDYRHQASRKSWYRSNMCYVRQLINPVKRSRIERQMTKSDRRKGESRLRYGIARRAPESLL